MRFALVLAALLLTAAPPARAEIPAPPPALEDMKAHGVQLRYLGKSRGFDSWVGVLQGVAQYYHVSPDGSVIINGVMMAPDGQAIEPGTDGPAASMADDFVKKTTQAASKSEQLFAAVEQTNGFWLGRSASAPVLYTFIDPNCPHCHDFIKDIVPMVDTGRVRVRVIPVGILGDESMKQAASLLTISDGGEKLVRYIGGDKNALPVPADINTQGIHTNMTTMLDWKLSATPFTVYRSRAGNVKIIEGRARSIDALMADITP